LNYKIYNMSQPIKTPLDIRNERVKDPKNNVESWKCNRDGTRTKLDANGNPTDIVITPNVQQTKY